MILRTLWAGMLLTAVIVTAGCKHNQGCCQPCCTPCCSPCTSCYSPGMANADPLLHSANPIAAPEEIQRVSLGVPVAP